MLEGKRCSEVMSKGLRQQPWLANHKLKTENQHRELPLAEELRIMESQAIDHGSSGQIKEADASYDAKVKKITISNLGWARH